MAEASKWVWITRTQKGAERTAQKVMQKGARPLVAPVLEVVAHKPEIKIGVGDAVVVTSENALHILCDTHIARTTKVYCVGDRTAQAVLDTGYEDVISAKGTVRDVYEIIVNDQDKPKRLIYLRGEVVSAPLKSWLNEAGFEVDEYIVYSTQIVDVALSHEQWARIGVIMLHSARAAETVAKLCKALVPTDDIEKMKIITISEAVASRFLQGLSEDFDANSRDLEAQFKIYVSATNDDEGMIALIDGNS